MTPAARTQAAIEIVDAVARAAREGGPPADAIVTAYFKTRRYAGSKDRRAVRELVWRAIRHAADCPPSGRAALAALAARDADLAVTFDGAGHGPALLAAGEGGDIVAGVCPAWLVPLLDPLVDTADMEALGARAPLDLRVNRRRGDVANLASLFKGAARVAGLPDALRLPHGTSVDGHPAYADGLFEIQDAASQYAAAALDVAPGMLVLDLCAGAGGKTLAIGAAMSGQGRIVACDTNRSRLSQLAPRAARAGLTNVETRLLDPGKEAAMLADLTGTCDRVIIDAPCSGSGTWRRSPELRWRLTPARLDQYRRQQAALLAIAAPLVAPGGALLYAVCALTAGEGRDQIAAFRAANGGWTAPNALLPAGIGRAAGDGWLLTPGHDSCDGFFMARLDRS